MATCFPLLAFVMQVGLGASAGGPLASAVSTDSTGPAVRITSPLGRSGTSGSIRIVAQIQPGQSGELGPVRFFIDGQLFRTDSDGAPYVAEWVDENPFERREIAVAVSDGLGHEVTDRVE